MTTDADTHEQLVQALRARADLAPDVPPLTAARRARIRRSRARRGVLTAAAVVVVGAAAFTAFRPTTDNAKVFTSHTVDTTPPPDAPVTTPGPTTIPWEQKGPAIRAFKAHDRLTSPYGPSINDDDFALLSDPIAITGNGTYTLTFRSLPAWFNYPERPSGFGLMSPPDAQFNVGIGDIHEITQDGQTVLTVEAQVNEFRAPMLDYTAWVS
jgi:hypothetical protein